MNQNKPTFFAWFRPLPVLMLSAVLSVSACSPGGDKESNSRPEVLSMDMQIPASLTGGLTAVTSPLVTGVQASTDGTGLPCAYQGPDDEDD